MATDAELENDETLEEEEENEEASKAESAKDDRLTKEQVTKLIENARKQEKDKLYGVIEDLKNNVKSLNEVQEKEQEAKQKLEQEAKDAAEKERQAALSADERVAEQLKKFEEELEQEKVARAELEHRLEEEAELHELERYRQHILDESGDEIIPELVSGDSKEAIERSAALAKARYQKLLEAAVAEAKGNAPRIAGPTDPDPAALDEAELAGSLANFDVDTDRYFGNRKKGIAKDHNYRTEVDQRREEIQARIGQNYRRFST